MLINLYDYTRPELTHLLQEWGYSSFYAQKLWHALYRPPLSWPESLAQFPAGLQQKLHQQTHWPRLVVQTALQSSDGFTRKFLLGLADGQAIETVIMRFEARQQRPEDTLRFTACLSTQAGCAMGCVFCATGQMGFTRHLSAGEIVGQVLFVQQQLAQTGHQLRNIVLMGMGEPLHNYDNTLKAIDILTDHHGLGLAPRHITLSTVGLPHGIRRLAHDPRPIGLAVSLHGATDAERQLLVPPAKKWPLSELMEACRYYMAQRQRKIFFEWTLIQEKNDTPEQAHALGQLLSGMLAHVNVIPLNPTAGYNGAPSDPGRVKAFQHILATYGLPSTVRQRRGIDIAAGCGQLKSKYEI